METIQEKWDQILEYLQTEYGLSSISISTWIQQLKIHKVEDYIVYMIIPQAYESMQDYFETKLKHPLMGAISEKLGTAYEVRFILENNIESLEEELDSDSNRKKMVSLNSSEYTSLNGKYTFDTFVVGVNNRLAYSACLAVAESPGEFYNPLFLYGGVGLGKTHLMHSIAHFIIENMPNKKVLYVTSESFTNEVIEAIRNTRKNNVTSSMTEFREKYRNVDVLLIDDIQFIIGKDSTQEEFFHTFNHLYNAGKHIIISSDKPPKEMETLEERLRTRFEMGLTTDISSPNYETRMAILQKKDILENYHMSDEVLQYIATNIKSNIRELEGALNKLIAYANLEKKEITVEIAEQELRDIISPNEPREVTPELILKVVSEHFNIQEEDIKSKKKNYEIAYPRQIVMYLCRSLTDISLKSIGNYIGGRDHSTIKHGVEKITTDYKEDTQTKTVIDMLLKKIKPS